MVVRAPDQSAMSQMSQSQPVEFPVFDLPATMWKFVFEMGDALGVDYAMVAGPALATLAGCIGNRRRIIVKQGSWYEPAVLWIATVMPSGAKKTPATSGVVDYLQEREAKEVKEAKERRDEYEEKMNEWKNGGDRRGEMPEKPEPATRLLVSDITVEALLSVHANSPLGLLLIRDELAGWILGFNQYKAGGKGSDAQAWTELYQGKPCLIDRKGAGTLSVPRAAVSIVGGVQPEVLRKAISGDHAYDGLSARILFVAPPEKQRVWSEKTVSDTAREEWSGLLAELLGLRANEDGSPVDLPMTEQAKSEWIKYHDEHGELLTAEENPANKAAMNKLEAVTARLALIFQLGENPQSKAVDVGAMKAAIVISNWFEGQARRVYESFVETPEQRDRREASEWIRERGGKITKREFTRKGPGRLRGRADEVLKDLVAAGLANRTPKSGHRGEEYILCSPDNEAPQDFD